MASIISIIAVTVTMVTITPTNMNLKKPILMP